MGSKHTPPRWWKDYAAECAASQAKHVLCEVRHGMLLYRWHVDGTISVLNMRAIHQITITGTVENQKEHADG